MLGIRDDDRVLRLDDATERAMKRPLVLGCVCQLRLKTCCEARDAVELESDR